MIHFNRTLSPVKEGGVLDSGVDGKFLALLLQALFPLLHHKPMVLRLFNTLQVIQCFLNLDQPDMISDVQKEKCNHEEKQHMVGFYPKTM